MGAIRVEVVSLAVQSQALTAFPVWLDCWRATVRIVAQRGQWFVDGVPAAETFLTDPSDANRAGDFFQLGGLVIDGVPRNLNHVLQFTPEAATEPCYGVVVKEYWDPQLPDPITNR